VALAARNPAPIGANGSQGMWSTIVASGSERVKLGISNKPFVQSFRYLGHIISASLCDNEDTEREIKNTFVCNNMSVGKFKMCSFYVKTVFLGSFV